MKGSGLILSAPTSGSGKTTVTLGLLRALRDRGVTVRGAKSGPDYIDPAFHTAACGAPCMNLDAWAMDPDRIKTLAMAKGLTLIEGAMGLFDGAPPDGAGATADLARILDLPVVLVVDARSLSHSVAPLVAGFAAHDPAVRVAGVILNLVGSPRHEAMLRQALEPLGLAVIGALPRTPDIALPSRHLGLVQALEHPGLEALIARAAALTAAHLDLDLLQSLAAPMEGASILGYRPRAKVGKPHRIALAQDAAFAFTYAKDLALWEVSGTEVFPFSPLANEPVPEADRIILPGGYPELFAAEIAGADRFLTSLREAAGTTPIYGECGGYMVLGEALTDAEGESHAMAGLLPLETSFASRKLHLGYRTLASRHGGLSGTFAGHEFHYATTVRAEGQPLFDAWDAEGNALPPMGLVRGTVAGSFAHIIDDSPRPIPQ